MRIDSKKQIKMYNEEVTQNIELCYLCYVVYDTFDEGRDYTDNKIYFFLKNNNRNKHSNYFNEQADMIFDEYNLTYKAYVKVENR